MADPDEPEPATTTSVEHATPVPASHRILVVDDNVDAADLLVDVLTLRGHVAIAAYDGAAALRVQQELQPDLAFVDIGLPQMDGYEVARRLAIAAAGQRLALVALTGYCEAHDRREAIAAGFVEHLAKPLSLATMMKVIERLLPDRS